MFIKKVEICNILGVKSASLAFRTGCTTYIIQSTSNYATRSTFSTAIELIFGAKYARMESLSELNDIQKGFVQITFLIPRKIEESVRNLGATTDDDVQSACHSATTSRAAALAAREKQQSQSRHFSNVHQIVACRDFRLNIADIIYSIDDAPKERCSPAAFHGKFYTNVNFVFPFVEKMHEYTKSGNLLKCIVEYIHYLWFQNQQAFKNLTCFQRATSNRIAFLSKNATFFLNTIMANNAVLKLNILKICQNIRTIFEYITCQEYTVWFFIPCQGKYIDMNKITLEDLDIDAIETCIQLKNCKAPRLIAWTDGDDCVKEMLLITLDLVVAFYCKTNLIFIKQSDAIKQYQSMNFSTFAYLQKFKKGEATWLKKKNYLQHIIDVCNALQIATIIENVGGLPIPTINAHIIKCSNEPPYVTVINTKPCNIDTFIECMEKNLV